MSEQALGGLSLRFWLVMEDNDTELYMYTHVLAYLSLKAFVRSRQYTSVVTSNKTYTQEHNRCYTDIHLQLQNHVCTCNLMDKLSVSCVPPIH